jgi:hypothetical protein
MDMRKLLMILALSLPLMAQEVEVKEVDGKTEVTVKKHRDDGDMRAWKQRGDMKRGDKKEWDGSDMRKRATRMHRASQERKKMHKKRAIRSAVRIIVVGGLAYYIGYHQGEKHFKGGWNRKPPMGDRK